MFSATSDKWTLRVLDRHAEPDYRASLFLAHGVPDEGKSSKELNTQFNLAFDYFS